MPAAAESSEPSEGSRSSRPTIASSHDAFLLDLDGVLFRGDQPIPGASEAVLRLRREGKGVAFVTNNSSRTARQVVEQLAGMGIGADPEEVATSAQATANLLSSRGVRAAFVIGEAGIREALEDAGIELSDGSAPADAVVVGFDRSADYAKLREASLLVQRGAALVATNDDDAFPAPDGLWPGAGALLAVITTTTGVAAEVVGKPHPPLLRTALERAGGGRPLVVGDRLDTDVAGADGLGWDSLLVLTGVTSPQDLVRGDTLPTFLGRDPGALWGPAVRVRPAGSDDVLAIEALLRTAALDAEGVPERVPGALVATVEPASRERAVLGTAAVEVLDGLAHLRSVAVYESARGALLGTLLTAAAVRLARQRGADAVYLVTEAADGFFAGLGFERIGTKDDLPSPIRDSPMVRDSCSTSAVAMVLRLGT